MSASPPASTQRNGSAADAATSSSIPVRSPSRQQPSRFSPQEHPTLFTSGPWPTLHDPQTTIFEGRQSPSRSLDEVVSDSASVQSNMLQWYEQQLQRHSRFKQALRDAERHGKVLGVVYGVPTSLLSSLRWSQWPTPCFQAPEQCRPSGSSETAEWTSSEYSLLAEAYKCGASVGTVVHAAAWFFIILIVTISVGVVSAGAVFLVFLVLDIALFVSIIGLSCYSGHRRKHAEYPGILLEELPRNVPSILQLEIAHRNAKMMQTLLDSERRSLVRRNHPRAATSEMRRAREEHETDVEIATVLEAARNRPPTTERRGQRDSASHRRDVAATFSRLAAAVEDSSVHIEAVDFEGEGDQHDFSPVQDEQGEEWDKSPPRE